jgi:hypothetical protein
MKALLFVLALASTSALAEDKKVTGSWVAADSTNIDFNETNIDGKMAAPAGFFLQGRQAQSLSQMVKLRSKWRSELRNSKSAVKSVVK